MNYAQRGMYIEMLIEQWDKGSLPDCPHTCAEILGGTDEEWVANWPVLRRKFMDRRNKVRADHELDVPTDYDPHRRIVNLRLEQYRRSLRSLKNSRAEAGKKGGHAKAQKTKENGAGKTVANPSNDLANPSFQSQSQTQSQTVPQSVSQSQVPPTSIADARSKRPIFRGQRLVVFEWMLDDLMRMLGPHTNVFDLHDWFNTLDARMVDAGDVIPQRDGGAWLQQQTLNEAIRRGLPLARAVPTVGKTAGNQAAAARFIARGQQ
jgi:hypothetical protein